MSPFAPCLATTAVKAEQLRGSADSEPETGPRARKKPAA
jgi:hypothetical protein